MEKFTLLVFSHNDVEKALRLVKDAYDVADEIVLVDSSNADGKNLLREARKKYAGKLRVFDTIALGYSEPLRNYFHTKCSNEWVLRLDADELMTEEFKKRVHGIIADRRCSAFAVRVYDVDDDRNKISEFFAWQIQLYRKSMVNFRGMLHEQPQVRGAVKKVRGESLYLEHMEKPKKAETAFEEYPKMEKTQRMSYRIYNRVVIDHISKFMMPEGRTLEGTILGRLIRWLLLAYETITLRKQEDEISYFDYGMFYFMREFVRVFREPRSIVDVVPYTRMFLRMIHLSRNAPDGKEMLEISKMINDIGITRFLELDNSKVVEVLTRKYANKPQGPSLMLDLLKEKYRKLTSKKHKYRNIIISPHIDDAFLSLGGLLTRDKRTKQKVVDIFTITNFTLKGPGNPKQITILRKKEEKKNARKLGVEVDFLPFYDNPVRKGGEKEKLVERVKENLKPYLDQGERVFFPLGIGNHIDHVVTSKAALELLHETWNTNIYFYEDLPYAIKSTRIFSLLKPLLGEQAFAGPLHPLVNPSKISGALEPEYVKYSHSEKFELCKAYESQIDWRILDSVMVYGLIVGKMLGFKERFWKAIKPELL